MQSSVWQLLVLALLAVSTRSGVAQQTLRIRLENSYVASINLGLARALRSGSDILDGTLTLQNDGTWKGKVLANVNFWQEMKGLGMNCPRTQFRVSQELYVTARSVSGFNAKMQSVTYRTGTASGFVALAVRPAEPHRMNSGDPDCLSLNQDDTGATLLPLNDARWNQPASGYIIGFPQSGVLEYEDVTVQTSQGPSLSSTSPADASSRWTIRVERAG